MKKITAAILLSPLLAHGATGIPSDPTTAQACYQNLAPASSKDDLLGAIACLKNNPFAGETTLKEFQQSQTALLTKFQQSSSDADVRAALAELAAQKAQRLYISYQARGQKREVFVVDKVWLGGDRPSPALDIFALRPEFIHTSAIFGKDKHVPLQDVRAFSYQERGVKGIGQFATILTDKRQIVDEKYQGGYSLKVFDLADESKWAAIIAFSGTSYQAYPPNKGQNDRIALDQPSLAGFDVTFLTEDEARQRIAKVEQLMQAEEAARDKQARAANEKAQLQMQKKAQTVAEMAKAQRGSEDSCKRTDLNGYVVKYDPDFVEINCQFGGVVELTDLKSAGWLVINKTKDKDGVVTDYYIRKAR